MNNDLDSTFERCPHDKENPYAMINRELIRDNSLTPECRWLIIFLLSHDDGWIIKPQYIINQLKGLKNCGRDRVYEIIKEAMDAGYIKRTEYLVKNMTRYKYYVSETPFFSKNFSDIRDCSIPAPSILAERTLKNKQSSSSEEDKKEQYKEGSEVAKAPPPPSADAAALTDYFLSKIKEKKPDFELKSRKKWDKDFDLLLRLSKRSMQRTKQVIDWLTSNDKELAWCLCPQKLRDKFDAFEIKMNSSQKQTIINENRAWALMMKAKYPDPLKSLSFDNLYARNLPAAKELPFNMHPEAFQSAFVSMFGGSKNG